MAAVNIDAALYNARSVLRGEAVGARQPRGHSRQADGVICPAEYNA